MEKDVKTLVAEIMERHKGLLEALARGVDPWPYSIIPDEKLAFKREFSVSTEDALRIYGPIWFKVGGFA